MAIPHGTPTEKKAKDRKNKIHKRVYITRRTDLLLTVMNELMNNDVYDEFVETCILYGLAYLNDRNKVNFVRWSDRLVLPSLKDVDQLMVDESNG